MFILILLDRDIDIIVLFCLQNIHQPIDFVIFIVILSGHDINIIYSPYIHSVLPAKY